MEFDWWTLALQGLNFLVLVWLLRRFLYRPVQQVISERRVLAEEAFAKAKHMEDEARASRAGFDAATEQLEQERQNLLRSVHEETQHERKMVLQEAQTEAQALLEDARSMIEKDRAAVLVDTQDQVVLLAAELTGKLLSQLASKQLNSLMLDKLVAHLNVLPKAQRNGLIHSAEGAGVPPTVITAAELASDEQRTWTARLNASMDRLGDFDFRVVPEILGGAEIRFQHSIVRFTWADQLEQAQRLLHPP
jgi:F-type H+-transporting ATPase subunit b